MSKEKMVAVPQSLLDAIEVSRQKIYAMHPETKISSREGNQSLSQLLEITQPIWQLANTKWKEVK